MSYFEDVKGLHRQFGISGKGFPKSLSKEEHIFRIGCMLEEVWEYAEAVLADNESIKPGSSASMPTPDEFRSSITGALSDFTELRKDAESPVMLEKQMDALVDLSVFCLGTAERQGFDFDEGWNRVYEANSAKEIASTSSDSKRGFKLDLVKPDGWKAPRMLDLVSPPKGIIVLEGPDGTGKTSLGHFLVEKFGGVYLHQSWSEEIEKDMPSYMQAVVDKAARESKDKLVVLDRHWVSEFIYSKVFRGGPCWPDIPNSMFYQLKILKAVYVFCLPGSTSDYLSKFEKLKSSRKEMYSTMDAVLAEYKEFVFGKPDVGIDSSLWNEEYGALVNCVSTVYDYEEDPDGSKLLVALHSLMKGE